MYIEFIKEHPVGIAEGRKVKVSPIDGERFIKQGYAKEIESLETDAIIEDKFYKALTQEDIEKHPDALSKTIKLGDEVEVDKDGNFIFNGHNNFTKKK